MKSKSVKVWVVWQLSGKRWVAMWVERTRRDAEERARYEKARYEYDGRRDLYVWRVTSGTVNPPGEGK